MKRNLRPAVCVVGAVVCVGAAAVAATSSLSLVPMLVLIFVALGLGFEARRSLRTDFALEVRLAQHVAEGRRLAIYERQTNLLARWYLDLRCAEEVDRAKRYARPLTLSVLESEDGDAAPLERIADWLGRSTRSSDLVGYAGTGRFLVLMPETEVRGAARLTARTRQERLGLRGGTATFGADGNTFAELYTAACNRLVTPGEATAA